MRWAQRGGSLGGPERASQQVEVFEGKTATEVGVRISEMVADYAVRVVSMSCVYNEGPPFGFTAIVVFEEDPV